MLALQPVEPLLGAPTQLRLRLLGECQVVLGVTPLELLSFARLLEPLGRVLADRLQHPEPLLGVAQQALVDERLQGIQVGLCHFLCGLERAAAGKDGEASEEALLRVGDELVAPFDRRPQRLLARVCVAAGLEQVEPLREPLEDLGGRKRLDPGRGQLDG